MFTMNFKAAKEGFFDRAKVIGAVGKASIRVLSRFGAFVRTRARSSIRKRKKISLPGQAPSSHVGTLKDLIFFSYDQGHRSVVIGPTLSNRPSGATATLEYGGDAEIQERLFKTKKPVAKKVRIKARPYMHPAFQAELPGLPAMWENSVR